MIEEAKRRTPGSVNCVLADVLADPLPGTDYDAIFSVSALHHMPLQDSLPVLGAAAVLPGVRLRRLLFWRYLLIWQKPIHPDS